jgi:hypothetical protein
LDKDIGYNDMNREKAENAVGYHCDMASCPIYGSRVVSAVREGDTCLLSAFRDSTLAQQDP